jgi:sigma-B regulation protein RsbU (phosphoserine phosphatase)
MARLERIVERLERKEFQLRTLLEVTKAINANVPRTELLTLYERIVRDELGITRLMLFERGAGWERVLAYGDTGTPPAVDVDRIFAEFGDIQVIGPAHATGLGAFDVVVPVHHQDRPIALLLIGDIDEEEQRMSPVVKHLVFIQTLTNLVVVAMENRRLAQQALEQERAKRELELAKEMQGMLVPRDLPDEQGVSAAAWYQPHNQVGGDYYDLLRPSPGEVVACVADVSGKGIAAALLMSNFQANLRAAVARGGDLHQVLHDLNAVVHANARGERFITLHLAHADLRQRRLRYASAGHNPALLHHAGQVTVLGEGSIALGMMPSLPFLHVGEMELPRDATLLSYTDGLVEQEDARGACFDTAPLLEALRSSAPGGPASVIERVTQAFEAHRNGQPYLDDIAVLACRFT